MTEQMQTHPQVQRILMEFERLNEEGREKLAGYANDLTTSGKYTPQTVRMSWIRRRQKGRIGS